MSASRSVYQTTLKRRVTLEGTGVHSGKQASLTFNPADAGSGVRFQRSDNDDCLEIQALWRHVSATELCTALGGGCQAIATIEHVMAALRGLEIDNVLIEVDSGEVPVMDGSAMPIVDALDSAGIRRQKEPRRFIKVLRPVEIRRGESVATFFPHDDFFLDIEIDFASDLIGRQRFAASIEAGVFRKELARARTFGFLADVEQLWQRGLALGASLENAVVIGEDRIVNPEGLRFTDEFVRHKTLDAVGDLGLAGAPIIGGYRSYRGGHKLNVMAVEALLSQPDAWSTVELAPRRETAHADLHAGIGVPAYGPDAS